MPQASELDALRLRILQLGKKANELRRQNKAFTAHGKTPAYLAATNELAVLATTFVKEWYYEVLGQLNPDLFLFCIGSAGPIEQQIPAFCLEMQMRIAVLNIDPDFYSDIQCPKSAESLDVDYLSAAVAPKALTMIFDHIIQLGKKLVLMTFPDPHFVFLYLECLSKHIDKTGSSIAVFSGHEMPMPVLQLSQAYMQLKLETKNHKAQTSSAPDPYDAYWDDYTKIHEHELHSAIAKVYHSINDIHFSDLFPLMASQNEPYDDDARTALLAVRSAWHEEDLKREDTLFHAAQKSM